MDGRARPHHAFTDVHPDANYKQLTAADDQGLAKWKLNSLPFSGAPAGRVRAGKRSSLFLMGAATFTGRVKALAPTC